MPTLSVYIGESRVSALRFVSHTDYSFVNYPYSFPKELLKGFESESLFYSQVLGLIEKELQIDVSNFDIVVGSLSKIPDFVNGAEYSHIFNSLEGVENYYWIMANRSFVAVPGGFSSNLPYEEGSKLFKSNVMNSFANRILYPSVIEDDSAEWNVTDSLIKAMASSIAVDEEISVPLVFTGDRFASFAENKVRTYLLSINLVESVGIHEMLIDDCNKFPAVGLLNEKFFSEDKVDDTAEKEVQEDAIGFISNDVFKVNDEEIFEKEFNRVGTILYSPGGVECLFEAEPGNSKLVELRDNQLYIFPLAGESAARVVIDSKSVKHTETQVRGGDLGFIIDTRKHKNKDFDDVWLKVVSEKVAGK